MAAGRRQIGYAAAAARLGKSREVDPLAGIGSDEAPPHTGAIAPKPQARPAAGAGLSAFLGPADVVRLTGYTVKSRQVAQLAGMGVAFYVNGRGVPVVPRSAVEGQRQAAPADAAPGAWAPGVLKPAK